MFNLEEIYNKRYAQLVKYIAYKIGGSVVVAEELANDVFIKAHKNKDSYDKDISSEYTWLITIAKNVVIDHYRKRKLDTISIHSEINDGEEEGYDGIDFKYLNNLSTNNTPHLEMIRKEQNKEMLKTFRMLPKKSKRAFNLFYNHQVKIKDICTTMGENKNTIKGWLLKSREIFREECSIIK